MLMLWAFVDRTNSRERTRILLKQWLDTYKKFLFSLKKKLSFFLTISA